MRSNLSFSRFFVFVFAFMFAFGAMVFPQSGRQKPTGTDQKKNQKDQKQGDDKKHDEPKEELPKDIVNTPKDGEIVSVATSIINVDAVVYSKKTKQIITGLKKDNFAIFEDGQQVSVTNFSTPEAPITVAVVMEFSKLSERFGLSQTNGMEYGKTEVVRPVAAFLTQFIKPPDDYASVIAFDMRPTPLTDFTNDPRRIQEVISLLLRNNPAFTETNLFDAVKFTLIGGKGDAVVLDNTKERYQQYGGLADIQGRRKAILLVASGLDTFSKINYDQARKVVQQSGVPIYIIGTGNMYFKRNEGNMSAQGGLLGATTPGRMDFHQAQNTLTTFAKESGGAYIPVTFEGEIPSALQTINVLLRNQYSLAFSAEENKKDGKSHKLVVKVDVDGDGKFDDKDYTVQHRTLYSIPKPGEKTK